jgi:hypothetical protein
MCLFHEERVSHLEKMLTRALMAAVLVGLVSLGLHFMFGEVAEIQSEETTQLFEARTEETEKAVNKHQEKEEGVVKVSVFVPVEKKSLLEKTSILWQEGDTVFDALEKATKKYDIPFKFSGLRVAPYVSSIGGIEEFDHGVKSGWMVAVNGEVISKSSGAYVLKEHDIIEWVYTTDLGRDIQSYIGGN